jgi:Cytochrome c7 and related cytochrome c
MTFRAIGRWTGALVLLLLMPWIARAAVTSAFDHYTTGFELVGQHRSVACESCHVGGVFKGTPKDCFTCHSPGARDGASAKPSNHILSSNDCQTCHTPYGWRPVTKFNHINVLGSCSSCHNGVQSVGKGPNHIPTLAECSTCHLVSLPWTAAHYDHAGIHDNCARCHDNVHAPGKPLTHVPTTEACEVCHSPSNFVTFAGTMMNHVGITNNCQSCHETGMQWYGLNMVDRPTLAADPYHPTATSPGGADCSNCHVGFNVGDFNKIAKPANHIPTAPVPCINCHVLNDMSIMAPLPTIHQNAPSATTNCQQCHGTNAASFALPAINFAIVGIPSNHLPTTLSCEVCHVGAGSSMASLPVPVGAKFTNSLMNHAGSATCAACHGPTVTTFIGVQNIIVMPRTSPAGDPGSHIPVTSDCVSCHSAATPKAPMAPNATSSVPGSLFLAPAPTTQQIHSGVTTGCQSCHEGGYAWMSMAQYPLSPAAVTIGNNATHYQGFQTRPGAVAGQFMVQDPAHPANGDCVTCHGASFQYFSALALPQNHMPVSASASCTDCHKGSDFAVMPSLADIHAFAPSQTTNCTQCHSGTSTKVGPFVGGAGTISIVGTPTGHIPTTQSCEVCHLGANSSFASLPVKDGYKFGNSQMNHAGLTTCNDCHAAGKTFYGITKIILIPSSTPAGNSAAHIPVSGDCASCHQASMPAGLIAANATRAAPGSLFQLPAPTTAQIHAGIGSNCQSCHEGGYAWMSMGQYAINPSVFTSGAQYTGFQTRPGPTASAFVVKDAAHPSGGDCVTCHGTNTNYFESVVKPANHIPYASSATCANCHKGTDYSVMPALIDIHTYAQSKTTNCAQCHGANAASFAIPSANFQIVGLPATHIPTGQSCEVCHVGAGSSVTSTPVPNGAKFAGSRMNHSGITTCVECHGPTITGSSFVGISKIIVMPSTSPAGAATAHIPSGTNCEQCHQGSMPSGLIAANATATLPNSGFLKPAPTTTQIHTGVTGNCTSCHESNYAWMSMGQYPLNPATLQTSATAQYTGFQTRPSASAGTFMIQDAKHPAGGDCVNCHSTNFAYFSAPQKPSNHIPVSGTSSCTNCHKDPSGDFSVMPALVDIHTYAPSTSTNCAQCHGSSAASYAIPSINFNVMGLPSNHLPTTQSCEVCHVGAGSSVAQTPVPNGAKFSGSQMNHAGITTCVACHGPTVGSTSFVGISKIIVMPATSPVGLSAHMPSGTNCEQCHVGTMPSGLIGANATTNAPGSKFLTPAPTTTQIHTGVTGNCSSCHEGGNVWMSVSQYPISPTAYNANAQYTGFQTRPSVAGGTYQIADSAHPTSGDCVTCHGTNFNYFASQVKPSNHIPVSSAAACGDCHKSPDYSVMPALVDIHTYAPSQTTNCTQCHASPGTTVGPFAGPSGFVIKAAPSNHIPTTQSCEVCHVGAGSSIAATPVPNGALFSNSKMNHAGIATCVDCHGPSVTSASFIGISKIIVMPPTSPAGSASAHVPSGTACEQCHLGSMPSGLVNANSAKTTPGSGFLSPAPTTAQIHTGVTSGCQSCHEGGYVWMSISAYPINPTTLSSSTSTQYTGFQTRPNATGGLYQIKDAAHPTSGDCVSCHGTTFTYFSGTALPANHIPILSGAACSTCHTTAGNYAVYTPDMNKLHTAVTTACSTCHADGKGPFAGAPGFAIVQRSTRGMHIPITNAGVPVECSGCHKVYTSFAGTIMSHAAIGDSGSSAAGNACDACHEYGFRNLFYGLSIWQRDSSRHYICGNPGTPTAPNTTICSGGGSDCTTGCHQHSVSSRYKAAPRPRPAANAPKTPTGAGAPSALTGAASADRPLRGGRAIDAVGPLAITREPGRFDHGSVQGQSCVSCHNGVTAQSKATTHPRTTDACAACHGTIAWTPVIRLDHADVLGSCVSCHDGHKYPGKSARHVPSGNDCDRCHTTSAWAPAAFDHSGVLAGTCVTCHNGLGATGLPPRHPVTTASCDTCHYVLGWTPVKPTGLNPTQRAQPPLPRLPAVPSRSRLLSGAAVH